MRTLMRTELRLCFQKLCLGEEDSATVALAYDVARERLEQAERYARSEALFATINPSARIPFLGTFDALRARMETPEIPFDERGIRHLLTQYAPFALSHGYWVIPLAGTATVHRKCYAVLLRYYADSDAWSVPGEFRALLALTGIRLPEIVDDAFAGEEALLDAAFLPAMLQIGIARLPEQLFPELLGLLLGQALGLLPFRSMLAGVCRPALGDAKHRAPFLFSPTPRASPLAAIADVIEGHLESAGHAGGSEGVGQAWARIQSGLLAQFLAEQELVRSALDGWKARLQPDLRQGVIRILEEKRPYGLGHHRAKTLAGRRIDEWLAPGEDLERFLDALAESDLVDPAAPSRSPLLALLSPEGPMYRIFREDEIGILVQWIGSLGELRAAAPCAGSASLSAEPRAGRHARPAVQTGMDTAITALDSRQIFHRLLNPERYLDERPAARRLVERCLRRTARALHYPLIGADLGYFPYSRAGLRGRLDAIHRRAIAAYRPFVPPPRLCREEYLWLLVRLAPLVLVDGAWLQRVAWLDGRHAQVGTCLRAIYTDEIGGRDPEHHHANIFRRLLDGEGIRLPEVCSAEFIAWPGFFPALFDLPAYLLAISQFPRAFLPEILGLNLAIELSGLGAFYMTAVDEMAYLGLDPAIVSIHLASDNLASGHAALARDAIVIYLDRVGADFGHAERDRHWRRVWQGYTSLQVVPRRAWAALFARSLLHFAPARFNKRIRERWDAARS